MSVETRAVTKTHFQTGDKPTQQQFINLIDSAIWNEDFSANNTVLIKDSSGAIVAVAVSASRIIGRKASGEIGALTSAEVLTVLGITLSDYEVVANKSTNTSLGSSDTLYPSQKAVKTYVDALLAANDAMVYKGATDCSGTPNYPAADAGHTYRVSVAGKIGGASGIVVEVGDFFICNTDATSSGNQATVGTKWNVIQTNIDGAVVGPASATDNAIAVFDLTTGKLIKNSGTLISSLLAATGATVGATSQIQVFTNGIRTAAQDAVQINPFGVGAGQTGEIRFLENTGGGTNYVGFKSADDLPGVNTIWVLPSVDGSPNQALTTDGFKNLGWTTFPAATSPAGSHADIQYNQAGGFGANGDGHFTWDNSNEQILLKNANGISFPSYSFVDAPLVGVYLDGADLGLTTNGGSLKIDGNTAFSGSGAFTNFTIVNGIITAAS